MRTLLRFSLLAATNILSRVFFSFTLEWVGRRPAIPFRHARMAILLNHTSLFEPIFLAVAPFSWLWKASCRGLMPGADSTLNRPLAGRFFKWMVPDAVSVTRNRDRTWTDFISRIRKDTIIIMSPEGRMRRRTGLDKHGQPMTMRGGIVDVLDRINDGTMVFVYSGGLHHIQAPGEGFPRLFQRVRVRLEEVGIESYKKSLGHGTEDFRSAVMKDLELRRDRHCQWG